MHLILPGSPELRKYVEFFWWAEIESSDENTFTYYSVASAKTDLLFTYLGNFERIEASGNREKEGPAGFYGQNNICKRYVANSRKAGIFGVRFYPHAIPALFSVSAAELTNQTIGLRDFLGNEGEHLTERIFAARTTGRRVEIISGFLEDKLRSRRNLQNDDIERAVGLVHLAKGQVKLPKLVESSGLSERQFERVFKEKAGFAPKFYLRIVRFEAALEHFEHNGDSLTDTALECGYFDQSHFIRDFKEFAKMTPGEYFSLRAKFSPDVGFVQFS